MAHFDRTGGSKWSRLFTHDIFINLVVLSIIIPITIIAIMRVWINVRNNHYYFLEGSKSWYIIKPHYKLILVGDKPIEKECDKFRFVDFREIVNKELFVENYGDEKTVKLKISFWQGKKGIHIHFAHNGQLTISGMTTISNDEKSQRCHKHLYRQLKTILVEEEKWSEVRETNNIEKPAN